MHTKCTPVVILVGEKLLIRFSGSKFAKPNIDKVKNVALKRLVVSGCPALTKFFWRAVIGRSDRLAFVNGARVGTS